MEERSCKSSKAEADEEEIQFANKAIESLRAAQDKVSNLTTSIAAKQEALEHQKAAMLSKSLRMQGIKQERDSVLSLRPSSIVELNIGGTKIDVKRSTVTSFPSKLRWMLNGRWDHVFKRDRQGRILLDYDASWMEPIINRLRELAMQTSPVPLEPPEVEKEDEIGFRYLTRMLGLDRLIFRDDENEEGLFKSWMIPCMSNNIVSTVGSGRERCDFELLYRASRDGWSMAKHQQVCRGKANTMTIVRDTDGNVFGGFSEAVREFDSRYIKARSFLFRLSGLGFKVFRQLAGKEDRAVHNHSESYVVFGDGPDLFIINNCQVAGSNSCKMGYAYECASGQPYELTGGKHKFQVAELEVWRASLRPQAEVEVNSPTRDRIPSDCKVTLSGLTGHLDVLESFQHELLMRGVKLSREARAVEEEEVDLEQEKAYMQELELAIGNDEVVSFNIGGRKLHTMRRTLELVKGSKLYKYASGEVPQRDLDEDGDILLDVNLYCFTKIISHLRTRRLYGRLDVEEEWLPRPALKVSPAHEASFRRVLQYLELDWDELESLPEEYRLPGSAFFRFYDRLQPFLWCTREEQWKLVWRGSKDGYSAAAVHARVTGMGARRQLVIVKDGQGNVFGGYTSVMPASKGCTYVEDEKSLLFSLARNGLREEEAFKICHLNATSHRHAMMTGDGSIYHFGQSELVIPTDCDQGRRCFCEVRRSYYNHGDPQLLTSGQRVFDVVELEIWTLD